MEPKTKSVTIEYNGAKHEVKYKVMSDAEKMKLQDSIFKLKINPATGIMESVPLSTYQSTLAMLKMTVVNAPFTIDEKGMNELRDGNLNILIDEITKNNQLTAKKKDS